MVRVRENESFRLAVARRIAMAKRTNTQNKGGETSNPPTQREIGGGETPNPPSQREIGGETLNPPSQREMAREETPNPPSPREIVGGETRNPPSPSGSKSSVSIAKAERKWGKTLNEGGETSNHPPLQKEIGGGKISIPHPSFKTAMAPKRRKTQKGKGETSNPPPHHHHHHYHPPRLDWRREFDSYISKINTVEKTSNPLFSREIGEGETLNPLSSREIGEGENSNPPSFREIREGETSNPPSLREIRGGETLNPPSYREIRGGETSNPPSSREIREGETSNPPSLREIRGGESFNPPSSREIGEGEPSNPPTGGREEIGVTIDPRLLDCSICFDPLCPPVYQCLKGHVACLSCLSKLQNKCPICGDFVGSRIIAFEALLESIHLPCPNANFGCRLSVSYSQIQVHTQMCEFGPSQCPIPECGHKAFSGDWREHFMFDHRFHCNHYRYGQSCALLFDEVDPYYTLFGPGKDLFLLVKVPIPNVGNALSIYYIDLPDRGQKVYPYELEVHARENYITSSIHSKSEAVSIKEWKRGEVRGRFCLGPSGFPESRMKVNVLINIFPADCEEEDVIL